MSVVIDASLLLAIYLEEPTSQAARAALAREVVIAPELIAAELANGLWRAQRTGRLDPADARRILPNALKIFTRVTPLGGLVDEALVLSIAHDHPVYDCFYVALARQEGLPLLTGDRRLAARLGDAAEIRLLA